MKLVNILFVLSCFLLVLLVTIFLLILFMPKILPEGTDITFAYITNIGAIATVLVAIAAFLTIKAANEREKHFRIREEHSHKQHLLD